MKLSLPPIYVYFVYVSYSLVKILLVNWRQFVILAPQPLLIQLILYYLDKTFVFTITPSRPYIFDITPRPPSFVLSKAAILDRKL